MENQWTCFQLILRKALGALDVDAISIQVKLLKNLVRIRNLFPGLVLADGTVLVSHNPYHDSVACIVGQVSDAQGAR